MMYIRAKKQRIKLYRTITSEVFTSFKTSVCPASKIVVTNKKILENSLIATLVGPYYSIT